jgi:hypothetical protein
LVPGLLPDVLSHLVRTLARIEGDLLPYLAYEYVPELVTGLMFNTRSRPRSEWLPVLEWSWGGVALAVPWGRSYSVLKRIMGDLPAVFGRLGAVLGRLGAVLERLWGDLGTSWDSLEASSDVLGRSWVVLEPSCSHLGAVLGRLGAILGPPWSHLGASMGRLGAVFGRLGVFLSSFLWLSSELRKSLKNLQFS